MRTAALVVLGLAACDGGTTVITIHSQQAAFVALKEGEGSFEPVALTADGDYEIEVDAPFGFAVTCDLPAGVITGVMFRAPDESSEWRFSCETSTPPPMHTITVTSVDNTALFGGCGAGYGMGNTFTFEAPEGPCDLLFTDDAGGNYPSRVWRKNIEITGDTAVDVDLRDGEDMIGIGLIVDGGSLDYTTNSFIRTPHGTVRYFYGQAQAVRAPSPDVMLDGDAVAIRMVRNGGTYIVQRDLHPGDVFEPGSAPLELNFPTEDYPGTGFRILDGKPYVMLGSFVGEPRWLEAQQPGIEMYATWSDAYEAETEHTDLMYPNLPSLDGWDPAWSLVDATSWQMQLHHELDDRTFFELNVDTSI